jgi:hypothetical protein
VSLHFGGKVPLKQRLENPKLMDALRTHEGEYVMFIECAWRIDERDQVVAGCWDDNADGGPMLSGLRRIVGQPVRSIEISGACDLTIAFEGDLSLRVFCDQTNEEDGGDNYSLFTPSRTMTVGCRSRLAISARTGA